MPKITIQAPEVDLKAPQASEISSSLFTQGAKTFTEAAKTLNDTVQQFKKVRDYNEVTGAEVGLRESLGQIEQAAQQETDPNKLSDYQKQIDDAIVQHSGKISDQLVRDEAVRSMNLTGYSTYSSITNTFRKKAIDLGRASYFTDTNQAELRYSNSDNEIDRQKIRTDWTASLDKAHAAGLFDAEDVAKMKIQQNKNFDKRDLYFDIQNMPNLVEARYKQGAYASLTPQELQEGFQDARSMAEKIEKQQKEDIKKAQIANETSLVAGVANGMLHTVDDVNAMVGNGEVRPEIGKAYIKFLTSPALVNPETDETGYVKLVEGIFKAGNQEGMVRAIKDTLDGGSDGKVRQEDIQNMIALAVRRGNELYSVDKDGLKIGSKQADIDALYKSVMNWANTAKLDDKAKASLASDWINSIVKSDEQQSPKDITDAVIKRSIVAQHPEVASYDDVPNMVISKDSPIRLVFPKTTNVFPRRIYNPKTGRLELNPEVNAK